MAYIIAHGTVEGYRKISQPPTVGSETQVITDIRAEFDNTSTMLEKDKGYLIQMSSNGIWISIVKLLFDGERHGNGSGFFAFSAYIPNSQVVEGNILKSILDKTMSNYLTRLSREYFTQSNNVDWSFVEQASQELNSKCQYLNKAKKTNYQPSNKFAYVNATTEEQVIKYLDKPFQPEYGLYKAVFIGTHLQNPNHLSSQTLLNIDFDNEVYEIIWQGNSTDYPDVHLPQNIRKKEIPTSRFIFERKHYKDITVSYSDGQIDEVNGTITMGIPKLIPIEYKLKFIFNHPEAVKSLTATDGNMSQKFSEDKETLIFCGAEMDMQWHFSIQTNVKYQGKELDFSPFQYIEGGYGVSLIEMKSIDLQILNNEANHTNDLIFLNRRTNVHESPKYNKGEKKWEFRIPETDSFGDVYQISLQPYLGRDYTLQTSQRNETSWVVNIIKKEVPATSGGVTAPHNSTPDNHSSRKTEVPPDLHRNDAPCREDGKKIDLKLVGSLTLFVLVLACVVFITLCHFGYIDNSDEPTTPEPMPDNTTVQQEYSAEYRVLNEALEKFSKKWNKDSIFLVADKYAGEKGSNTENLKKNDSIAYVRLKQLSWLWRTREIVNNRDWNKLTDYVKEDNPKFKEEWINYYDKDKISFLRELINAPSNSRKRFEQKIKQDKQFSNKSYSEIVALWEECKKQNDNGKGKNNPPNNNNSNSNNNNNGTSTDEVNAEKY